MCSMANPQIVHNLTIIWRICHKSTFHSIPRFYRKSTQFLECCQQVTDHNHRNSHSIFILLYWNPHRIWKYVTSHTRDERKPYSRWKKIDKDINMKPLAAWRQEQCHLKKQIKLFIFNKIQCILHIIQICQHKILGQIQVNSVRHFLNS